MARKEKDAQQAAWKRMLTTSHTQLNRSNRRHLSTRSRRTGAMPAALARKAEAGAATARVMGELRKMRVAAAAAERQAEGVVEGGSDARSVSEHLQRLQGAGPSRSRLWGSSSQRAAERDDADPDTDPSDYFPVSPPRADEEREDLTSAEQMRLLQALRPRTFGSHIQQPGQARPLSANGRHLAPSHLEQQWERRPASAAVVRSRPSAARRGGQPRAFVRANHYTGSRTIFARSLVTFRPQRQASAARAAAMGSTGTPCVFRTGGGGLPWWYRGL